MEPISALDRMHSLLKRWDLTLDARAIFLRCYAMMTQNMHVAVEAGEFEDNNWVSGLLEYFAVYYFAALEAYEQSSAGTPAVWKVAFQAASQPRTHALQNLLLGVNAHINYDLVFTVADLLDGEWRLMDPVRRQLRYRDYCRVNEIINRTIDDVQDQVLEAWSPSMSLVDDLFGSLDEWLVTRKISDWREQVWEQAVAYLEQPDINERQTLRQRVETASLQRASAILGEQGLMGYLTVL
jgi:hypothetical protein